MLSDLWSALGKIGVGLDGLTQLLGMVIVLAVGAAFAAGFAFLVLGPLIWPDFRRDAFSELRKRPVAALFNAAITVGMCGFLAYVFLGSLM